MKTEYHTRLKDARVLVIGAASGIGRASALRLATEGASLAVADRNGKEAKATAAETGGPVFQVDVTDESEVERCLASAASSLGGLTGVFSTAGMLVGSALEETSLETWTECLEVNATGAFLVAKHSIPHLKRSGGGAILLTSSTSGLAGSRGQSAYCASKHAIIGLTRALADELAEHRIRVNCLAPGWIDTPFNDPVWELMGGKGRAEAQVLEMVPQRRQASPDEVAAAAAFLLSSDASYVNGVTMEVDGGLMAVR
jgi:NAD(P)-dependent dehydrogenase (short-subunit alcohol dehydrogenase family)